jgi:hypothetical protein
MIGKNIDDNREGSRQAAGNYAATKAPRYCQVGTFAGCALCPSRGGCGGSPDLIGTTRAPGNLNDKPG